MVFITSWNLNAFVSRALNPKLLDIDFTPLICSVMKPRPLSIDSTEIYGNVFVLVNPSNTHSHTPHAVQYLPTPTAFLMQLPLGWENV